jgi:hypothetical protein
VSLTEIVELAAGGLRVHVLPERGLDLGRAWFRDTEFAWISPLGELPWQGEFARSFVGGLVTTCGLRNVGLPAEGQPQHGWYSSLPARDLYAEGQYATARIVEADVPGETLVVTRDIRLDRKGVEITDRTRNAGYEPVPAPLLYHVNLWWDAVDIDSDEVAPRDDEARAGDWRALGEPGPERVYEHLGATRAVVTRGPVRATVTSSLPRLWQWIHPSYGVLGIEPSNCSVLGRAHDRAEGRLPSIEPGEERLTSVRVEVEEA